MRNENQAMTLNAGANAPIIFLYYLYFIIIYYIIYLYYYILLYII